MSAFLSKESACEECISFKEMLEADLLTMIIDGYVLKDS